MKAILRWIFARRLTQAERDLLDAARAVCIARAAHKKHTGHLLEQDAAWQRLNGVRREMRQSGLFETAVQQ